MKVEHDRDPRPLPADVLDDERLEALAAWGTRLAAAGLSPGESGNMSCRRGEGFLITRTGVSLAAIGPDDWVWVGGIAQTPRGQLVVTSRGVNEPSRDSAVHATVYALRPSAAAIFHFHVGSLDTLTHRLGVPTTSTYYPAGTSESMNEIARFLEEHERVDYFVLVDHGIVAVGGSIEAAGVLVEEYQRAVSREA